MKKKRLIIALTGAFGSGCSYAGKFIAKKLSLHYISISQDILEKKAGIKGKNITNIVRREKLQKIGDKLRLEDIRNNRSGGILIQEALKLAKENGEGAIIDSIKNVCEIEELRKHTEADVYVIGIDANDEVRRNRVKDTYKDDPKQFEKDNERDRCEDIKTKGVAYGQEVSNCVKLADIILLNEKNFEFPENYQNAFCTKVEGYIPKLRQPGKYRPLFNEIIMNSAYSVSLRSECLSRKVGAIIVKQVYNDYRFVSSGFNTTPPNIYSCKKEFNGCYRELTKDALSKKFKIKKCFVCGRSLSSLGTCTNKKCEFFNKNIYETLMLGKGLDLCRSLHAEENAILQTAHLGGAPLKDSILFSTTFPCNLCAKQIIAVGIKKVVYIDPYPMLQAKKMLSEASIETEKFEGVTSQAFYKIYKSNGLG